MDMSLNTITENNAIVESTSNPVGQSGYATTASLLNTGPAKSSMRQIRSDSGKSTIVIRGRANRKVEAVAKGKSKDETASKSVKQFLVSIMRS